MAEPLRKLPSGPESEPAPSADPFRYGSRRVTRRLPNGRVVEQEVPLTADDLLDPQLGDEVPQSDPHQELAGDLADRLKRRFAGRDDVKVVADMKMLWGIPGLKEPSPDIAVIPGVRKKLDLERTSFDVVKEGARPCLVIEVVSSTDAETRRNDYEKKVAIYQQARIPEYLILDPPAPATKGRLLLTGYRLGPGGRYRKIEPNEEGRLLSETASLLFGVADDGQTVEVLDAVTGEPLLSSQELETSSREANQRAAREAAGRRDAEERAAAAEAELARLRAELERRAG
jgi:Uma2 family endonuclease